MIIVKEFYSHDSKIVQNSELSTKYDTYIFNEQKEMRIFLVQFPTAIQFLFTIQVLLSKYNGNN